MLQMSTPINFATKQGCSRMIHHAVPPLPSIFFGIFYARANANGDYPVIAGLWLSHLLTTDHPLPKTSLFHLSLSRSIQSLKLEPN